MTMPEVKRPQLRNEENGEGINNIVTPSDAEMINLLGGHSTGNVLLTHDQLKQINRLYGYHSETCRMLQAGANRNAIREAHLDGMRIVAWLARFVEPGQDPLKVVVQLASETGLDVSYEDREWADNEECETD